MWRAREFHDDLDYVAERLEDDEILIEELQTAQAQLHQDRAYLNRRYQGGDLAFMGLVVNDHGYVLAQEEQDRGDFDNYYVLSFEKERNSEKGFLQPKDALRMETFEDSNVPDENATRISTWDFCYRLLKKLSDEPDQDMQALNPGYTPQRYR